MVKGYVTLVTNDLYVPGALALATSLRLTGTPHRLICVITSHVGAVCQAELRAIFDVVEEVNPLDSGDAARLAILGRPELGVSVTKVQVWGLTQFDRLVFLDADTLVLQNVDDLFDAGRASFAAAPDVGWPDCFNSGVFVFTPEVRIRDELVNLMASKGSFDGGDQGILNEYFHNWATTPNARLPFVFNVVSTAFYSYKPAFLRFKSDIKIYHFIGSNKPWLSRFEGPSASQDYEMRQLWWKYYDLFVTAGPDAIKEAARSQINILEAGISGLQLREKSSSSSSSAAYPSISGGEWGPMPDYMRGSSDIQPSASRAEHLSKFINYRVGWSDASFAPQKIPRERLETTLHYVLQELDELNRQFEQLTREGGPQRELDEIGRRIDGLNKARDHLASQK